MKICQSIKGEEKTIIQNNSKFLKVLSTLLKKRYMKDFNFENSQLDAVLEFYFKHKNGASINIERMEKFLEILIEQKQEVKANFDDVKRVLKTLDSDNDSFINLDEFIHLMVLFFANKENLEPRIESILRNQSIFHKKNGFLQFQEAADFYEFLCNFFGKSSIDSESYSNLFKSILNEEIKYKDFSQKAAPSFESYVFVK